MNKIILTGNVTRDPELTKLRNGRSVCRFTIAVSRSLPDAEGEFEADYFNVVAWQELGKSCYQCLQKGCSVCVSGSLFIRQYDRKDGRKRTEIEVEAEAIEVLSPRGGAEPVGGIGRVTRIEEPAEYGGERPF